MNPEMGHLYHDSHFTGVSGGALDAREQLRAREVNAREQRLLRKHDGLLERAKEMCQKRARWEQDSLRRQLRTILERTPTFDRTLETEKQRLRHRQIQTFYAETGLDPVPHNLATPQLKFPGKYERSFPSPDTSCSPSGRLLRLPPVNHSDPNDALKGTVGPATSTSRSGASRNWKRDNRVSAKKYAPLRVGPDRKLILKRRFGSFDRDSSPQGNNRPGKRDKSFVGNDEGLVPSARMRHTMPQSGPTPTPETNTPRTDQSSSGTAPSSNAHGSVGSSHKGADIRRRSHHAVMAIVRVQTRHERRMREAEAAMALIGRRRGLVHDLPQKMMTFPEPSEQMAEVSSQSQATLQL